MLRRPLVALVALAAAGVLAAGCGSNTSGSGGSGGTATAGRPHLVDAARPGVATVSAASTKLGMILVDGSGRTLYLFEKDQPNQSACDRRLCRCLADRSEQRDPQGGWRRQGVAAGHDSPR